MAAFLGILPINRIQEIIGFESFIKGAVSSITSHKAPFFSINNYAKGLKSAIIEGVKSEGIKGIVALGTRNQYFKQALEGGLGSLSHGGGFRNSFAQSFNSAANSYKDMRFEDHTSAGNSVKALKPFQATGGSFKNIF